MKIYFLITRVFALILFFSGSVFAQTAGYIIDFDGSKQGLLVTRGGKTIEVELGQELLSGDKVEISDKASLKLHTNGKILELNISNTPIVLGADKGRSLDGWLSDTLKVLAWWDTELQKKPMASRDGRSPFIATLEVSDTPVVIAGDRSLRIKWIDGAPPFEIRIKSENGEVLSSNKTQGNTREAFLNVELEKDATYKLQISGLGGSTPQTANYDFIAVDAQSLTIFNDFYTKSNSTDLALRALQIAGSEGGKYAFEASQQLYALKALGRIQSVGLAALDFGDWP